MPKDFNSFTRISSLSVAGLATQISSVPTTLVRVIVNVATTVAVGLIDGTSGTTANLGTLFITGALGSNALTSKVGSIDYEVTLGTGLRVITKGATNIKPDITVVWRQS